MIWRMRPGASISILSLAGAGDGTMGITGWTGITVTMVPVDWAANGGIGPKDGVGERLGGMVAPWLAGRNGVLSRGG